MFDLTSSKLLILGIVALIVVGPKELPFLLRTIGKYVGMLRRQANEFRAQFDEAMREAELDSIKKDLESVARDTENTIRSAQTSFESDVHASTQELDHSLKQAGASSTEPAHTFDALNGLEAGHVEPLPTDKWTAVEHTEASVDTAVVAVPVPLPEHISMHVPSSIPSSVPSQMPSEALLPVASVPAKPTPEFAKTGT